MLSYLILPSLICTVVQVLTTTKQKRANIMVCTVHTYIMCLCTDGTLSIKNHICWKSCILVRDN
jgi:hypothetical protein